MLDTLTCQELCFKVKCIWNAPKYSPNQETREHNSLLGERTIRNMQHRVLLFWVKKALLPIFSATTERNKRRPEKGKVILHVFRCALEYMCVVLFITAQYFVQSFKMIRVSICSFCKSFVRSIFLINRFWTLFNFKLEDYLNVRLGEFSHC